MWLGVAVFAVAICWTGWRYLTHFAEVPGAWVLATGAPAVAANLLLFAVFAVHHSVFARAGVKAWLARYLPPHLERSVYVADASLLLALVFWLWQPVPGLAWSLEGPARVAGLALQGGGALLTVHLVRGIDALAFAGARPQPADGPLRDTGLYRWVRHPLYVAWLLMVWPVPVMTGSRLLFAVLSTGYLIAAIPLEERSLARQFGTAYDAYRQRVRWRLLPGLY